MTIRTRLQLGLIPFGSSEAALIRVRLFASALSSVTGSPVELHKAADYRVLVSALEQGLVDFAWLPPLSAARGLRKGSIVPAAIAVRNGSTSYMTGLLTMKSSGIHTLDDVVGKRAAWVDRESASGYLVIRAALRAQGFSLVRAFKEEIFVRSHAEVARAIKSGAADVGATCFNFRAGTVEIARSGYKEEGGISHDEVNVLAHAGPIPSDIFAVHTKVAPVMLATLQHALVDARPVHLHQLAKDLMHADGFTRPTAEHVAMMEALYDTLDTRPSIRLPTR